MNKPSTISLLFSSFSEYLQHYFIANDDNDISIETILNEKRCKQIVDYYVNADNYNTIIVTNLNTEETEETIVKNDDDFFKPNLQEIKNSLLDRLISELVFFIEAEKRNISVTDTEVRQALDETVILVKTQKPREIMEIIEDLDMTIEEYFYDYSFIDYKLSILLKKVETQIISEARTYEEGVAEISRILDEGKEKFKKSYPKLTCLS